MTRASAVRSSKVLYPCFGLQSQTNCNPVAKLIIPTGSVETGERVPYNQREISHFVNNIYPGSVTTDPSIPSGKENS